MNELQYYSADDPESKKGFRTILATQPSHPYISHWWPPAHNIGYEHEFHHAVYDFLKAVAGDGSIAPNFYDGVLGMKVLEAGIESAEKEKQIDIE
jgi:predicted dehydrogenase